MFLVLAQWASKGVFAAAMVAFCLLALALVFGPFALYFSAATMGFVAMAQETKQTFRVLAIASITSVVFFAIISGVPVVGAQIALATWLPVMVLAFGYRAGYALPVLSVVAALMAMLALWVADQSTVNLTELVQRFLKGVLQQLDSGPNAGKINQAQAEALMAFAPVIPALFAGWLAINWLLAVLLSRSWYLQLYRNARLGDEFAAARATPKLCLAVIGISVFFAIAGQGIWKHAWLIFLMPMAMLGLCVVHGLSRGRNKWLIRIPVYIGVFVFGYVVWIALATLACIDSVVNLRKWAQNSSSQEG